MNVPTAAERRYAERQALTIYLKVINTETSGIMGYLADINEHGLMLITRTPIQRNQSYILEITLHRAETQPILLSDDLPHTLRFRVLSRWCRKRNSQLFSVGFELLKHSPKSLVSVHKILRYLAQNQWLLPKDNP